MPRFVLSLFAMLALAAPAFAQEIVAEKIPLKFALPSALASMLKPATSGSNARQGFEELVLPSGIVRITPNDRENLLTVHGTAEAIAQVKGDNPPGGRAAAPGLPRMASVRSRYWTAPS